jgi:hypothetical protein
VSNQEQPAPKATDRTPAWDLVRAYLTSCYEGRAVDALDADMAERDAIGRKRYGVPLTSGNGRDSLIDAYQECLDAVVYLRAWLDEHGVDPDDFERELTEREKLVLAIFKDHVELLIDMKEQLL